MSKWYEVAEDQADQLGVDIGNGVKLTEEQIRKIVALEQNPTGQFELGRALLAALGAAVGSKYATLGAGAGGAAGSYLYDMVKKLGIIK